MLRIFRLIALICVIYLALSLVLMPAVCIEAGRNAVDMCLKTVIPSLFPFLFCSGLFSALGLARICSKGLSPIMRPVFNIPGSGALAFVLGITSGYPMGAACAATLYKNGECSKTEAERMLAFCNNSGPLFIIAVVGIGCFGDKQTGYYLYAVHILSALITGAVFRFYGKNKKSAAALPPALPVTKLGNAHILGEVTDAAISTIFKICAYVILFSVVSAALPQGKHTPYIHSLLEITGGLKRLSESGLDFNLLLPLCSFFLAFSGISVVFQVNSVIAPHSLSIKPYIFGKLFQATAAFFLTRLLLTYIPITTSVFSPSEADVISSVPLGIFYISLMCCLFSALMLAVCSFVCAKLKPCSLTAPKMSGKKA